MGWQGTVLDVNTTAGVAYKLSLYMVSSVKPASKATWSFTKQAIRVMDLATLVTRRQLPLAMDNQLYHRVLRSRLPCVSRLPRYYSLLQTKLMLEGRRQDMPGPSPFAAHCRGAFAVAGPDRSGPADRGGGGRCLLDALVRQNLGTNAASAPPECRQNIGTNAANNSLCAAAPL